MLHFNFPSFFCHRIVAELLQKFLVSYHHAWANTRQLNFENLNQWLMDTMNLSTSAHKTIYFPLHFHFRTIYNPNKLKEILTVKSYQLIEWIKKRGNRFINSNSTRNFFICLKMFVMQWRENSWDVIKRMGSYLPN